ncbi:fimbria/pilus periplasmic chaperone [Serratia marcescens]
MVAQARNYTRPVAGALPRIFRGMHCITHCQSMNRPTFWLISRLLPLKRILLYPPITRIDAGQSQQVNFVLRKGEPLTHEVMLKASFEGIMQTTENSTQMPVRQSIGFIVQPAAVAVSKTPWDALTFQMENGELVMRNTGQRVVRMVPTLQLNPTNAQLAKDEYYLMVGETRRFKVANAPISVTFTPLSRYGFKLDDVTILVR